MAIEIDGNLWVVILAGGSGKRLWPLSRKSLPKQFIELDNSDTFLSRSISRTLKIDNLKKILIVAGESHLHLVKKTIKEFPDINCSILLEPEARNTAPAIYSAAKYINDLDKDSTMIVIPSDHYYEEEALINTVNAVLKVKKENQIITLGVKPSSPEIGYGYIHHNAKEEVLKKIIMFKEKPDLETAKEYFSTNDFFWNSGINIFDSSIIIQEFKQHVRELESVDLKFYKENNLIRIEKEEFSKLPNISIDYAILEKSENTYTSEFLGKWSDIGSWHSLRELRNNTKENNTIFGKNIFFEENYFT